MKVNTTTEWNKCGLQGDTLTILKDDGEWIKELVNNLRNCKSSEIKRQMTERYGGHISGMLLMYVWDKTKQETYA